jgi:hypothetical protein
VLWPELWTFPRLSGQCAALVRLNSDQARARTTSSREQPVTGARASSLRTLPASAQARGSEPMRPRGLGGSQQLRPLRLSISPRKTLRLQLLQHSLHETLSTQCAVYAPFRIRPCLTNASTYSLAYDIHLTMQDVARLGMNDTFRQTGPTPAAVPLGLWRRHPFQAERHARTRQAPPQLPPRWDIGGGACILNLTPLCAASRRGRSVPHRQALVS